MEHTPHRHRDHRRMHEATWTREQALALLDDPSRRTSENPAALWRLARLRTGMTVVDVGAGTGHYAFPASNRVGPTGRVYAVDVSEELVALLRERAVARRQTNLFAVRSSARRIPLAAALADRVLLANLLHGVAPATVAEAVRVLRPGGRLLDVDWRKDPAVGGPPVEHRLSELEAQHALEAYGLRAIATTPFGPEHYLLILEKPTPASPRAAGGSARRRRPRRTTRSEAPRRSSRTWRGGKAAGPGSTGTGT